MTWYRIVAAVISLTFLGICLVTAIYATWRVLKADDTAEHCTKD